MSEFSIRDQRKPGHYWADNEVLDNHGREIGAYGHSVYMYICRHAGNRDGRCNKSQAEIAYAFDISADTVQRSIQKLVDLRLVGIERPKGKPCVYIVLEVAKGGAAHSGKSTEPTAHSGNQLPLTAVGQPLTAVPLPLTAARNKEVRLSPNRKTKPKAKSTSASAPDPRFPEFVEALKKYWEFKNPSLKFNFSSADGRELKRFLVNHSAMVLEQFRICLNHRAKSDMVHSQEIHRWIGRAQEFFDSPLDQFWKVKVNGNAQHQGNSSQSANGHQGRPGSKGAYHGGDSARFNRPPDFEVT